MAISLSDKPTRGQIALAIRAMTYLELREMATELCIAASERAKDVENLGGFCVEDRVDWAELLVDWAEAN